MGSGTSETSFCLHYKLGFGSVPLRRIPSKRKANTNYLLTSESNNNYSNMDAKPETDSEPYPAGISEETHSTMPLSEGTVTAH